MTFQEAIDRELTKLDDAYAEVRKHHADLSFLNQECPTLLSGFKDFNAVSKRIFRLKELKMEVERSGVDQ